MTPPRRTESMPPLLRWLSPGAAIATLIAAIGLVRMTGAQSAWAQTAPCAPTQIGGDSQLVGYNGKASQAVFSCAPGSLLVGVPGSMPGLFEETSTVAESRYLTQFNFDPCQVPNGTDLPGATLNFSFVSPNPAARASQTVTLYPDNEKPTLKTTSQPPKNTKVKPGDRIWVRMEASEQYDSAHTGWQTGIQKIQLTDISRGQEVPVPPHSEYTGGPRPCAAKSWTSWLEVTYTVPGDPPPVIRLRASAIDHAGNEDTDIGEFPTTDWYGTIKATIKGNAYNDTADIQFRVDEAVDGTITGRGHVTLSSAANTAGVCTYTRTITPNRFEVEITGHREGDNLRLDLSTQGRSTWVFTTQCTRGGGSGTGPPAVQPRNALASFHALVPHIRVRARDGAANEITPVALGEITSGATITIHKARD